MKDRDRTELIDVHIYIFIIFSLSISISYYLFIFYWGSKWTIWVLRKMMVKAKNVCWKVNFGTTVIEWSCSQLQGSTKKLLLRRRVRVHSYYWSEPSALITGNWPVEKPNIMVKTILTPQVYPTGELIHFFPFFDFVFIAL